MGPTLSVIGLYNYDNTLFDALTIPQGMDKDAVIDNILTECATFDVLYPDPTFFKARLVRWNTRRLPIWQKLYDTTQYDYDPIANYDRTETATETVTHTGTDSTQSTAQTTHTGTDSTQTSAQTTHTGTDSNQSQGSATHTGTVQSVYTNTDTESKTAFNSDTLSTTQQVQTSGNNTDTNNLTDATTGSDTRTLNLTDSDTGSGTRTLNLTDSQAGTDTRTLNLSDSVSKSTRAKGNIGVTTTQQMIQAEREIDTFSVYDIIVNDFIDAFCVQVY